MPNQDIKAHPSTEKLTKKQKEQFSSVYKALCEASYSEESAVQVALTQAKKVMTRKSKTIPVIKATDDEQMIAIELVYEPYVPDAHGEWMSPETIRKACEDFNEKLSEGVLQPNLFHLTSTDKFEIVKSWINEVPCQIGDQLVPEGAWLSSIQYTDSDLWDLKKSGIIQGVSIGCQGIVHEPTAEVNND